jgi:transposase
MPAQVLSMSGKRYDYIKRQWRQDYFDWLTTVLDEMESGAPMDKLWDITNTILSNRSEILGRMALGLIESRYRELVDQEICPCSHCGKLLKSRGKEKREIETGIGKITLERPYFYCMECKKGFYPLDEALSLCEGVKQYDVQEVEAWLGSELPFQTAAEAYWRCTGQKVCSQSVHAAANRIAEDLDILDVCPRKEEIEAKIERVRDGRFRRPVMMLAIDGGHTPTRPEPSYRKGKRGKGEWKEAKGFRLYLIDERRIEHLICWHRVGTDRELAQDLEIAKNAGLIPEHKARLCLIGDGAPWIWNRMHELFPTAKEILDLYHCSERLHAAAHVQYGKGAREAQQWVEATLARLFHNQAKHVIAGLKRMKPSCAEAAKEIEKLIGYLSRHKERIHYGAAKRGGYHIGSGAIESAHKFIGHVRLKRSGAWWYPTHAQNILKLRCAKYNGTYDRIIDLYKERDQQRIKQCDLRKVDDDQGALS